MKEKHKFVNKTSQSIIQNKQSQKKFINEYSSDSLYAKSRALVQTSWFSSDICTKVQNHG